MWPVIAMVGASVVSGLFQAYTSAKARGASEAELKKLDNLINSVQSPQFDYSQLTPEDYQVVARYNPEVASFVEEQAPELIKGDSADAQMGRQVQKSALQSLMEASRGEDIQSQIDMQRAADSAAGSFRGMNQSILEQARQRGLTGSGVELASQLGTAQASYGNAATQSQNAATEAIQRRLQALREGASLGTQIRGEELAMEQANKNAINSFNQRTATRKQDWADNAAATRNEGQRFNITNAQDVSNRNVSQSNQFKVNERDRKDKLLQQGYDNEIGKVKLQAGITDSARSDILQGATDKNQMISGVTDGVNTALGYYMMKDQKKKTKNDGGQF